MRVSREGARRRARQEDKARDRDWNGEWHQTDWTIIHKWMRWKIFQYLRSSRTQQLVATPMKRFAFKMESKEHLALERKKKGLGKSQRHAHGDITAFQHACQRQHGCYAAQVWRSSYWKCVLKPSHFIRNNKDGRERKREAPGADYRTHGKKFIGQTRRHFEAMHWGGGSWEMISKHFVRIDLQLKHKGARSKCVCICMCASVWEREWATQTMRTVFFQPQASSAPLLGKERRREKGENMKETERKSKSNRQ